MQTHQSDEQHIKKAISLIIDSGYQLDLEALTFLQSLTNEVDLEEVIKNTLNDVSKLSTAPLFLTKKILEETLKKTLLKKESDSAVVGVGEAFYPYAKEMESEIEVLYDPKESVSSLGALENFLKYFRDRFKKIERIFKERMDVQDAIPISIVLNRPLNTIVKFIGIVTEKRERGKSVFLRIEDYETSANVLIPSTADKMVFENAQRIFLDQVVCIEAIKGRNILIAKNVINPNIPERKPNFASDSVYAALLSDLHIGSKEFLKGPFNHFIQWLKGNKGNNRQRNVAGRVKYLLLAGDVVDGVGVYPNQERDLVIPDLYEQYKTAAKLFEKIPEYIKIVVIPGNHDATREALPQPAIFKKYAEPLYEVENVMMLGNPAKIRLHGVEFLLYHGRSFDDIVSVVPEVTYQNLKVSISQAMKHLLIIRHLAPVYGGKTQIAPEPYDSLVIDTPPDVFHSGHVHVFGYKMYRGTLIINSGAWQNQTEFQMKMGLTPTPGIAPIFDLKTFNVFPISFL